VGFGDCIHGDEDWEATLDFRREGGDEYYDKYLQDRSGLWGYRPVENLENVSHPVKRGAQHF
jgi:hypothetical protein